jgi:hypothetical protein
MRFELTIPTDKAYVERLFDCLDKIEGQDDYKSRRLRSFIIDEFRQLRAKYNANPRIDFDAVIEAEDNRPLEKPLYQNTKLDKYKVARFDLSEDTGVDKAARIIRGKNNEQD